MDLAAATRAQVLEQLVKFSNESVRPFFEVRADHFVPYYDEAAGRMVHSADPVVAIFVKQDLQEPSKQVADQQRVSATKAMEMFLNKCSKKGKLSVSRSSTFGEANDADVLKLVSGLNAAFSPAVKPIEIPEILKEGRGNAVA